MKSKIALLTGLIILGVGGMYLLKSPASSSPSADRTVDDTSVAAPPAKTSVPVKAKALPDPYYDDAAAQDEFYQRSKDFLQRDAARDAELAALNPGWDIRQLWPKPGASQPILAACLGDDRKIYFLSCDLLDYQLLVYDGSTVGLVATAPLGRDETGGNFLSLQVTDGKVLAAGWKRLLTGTVGEKRLHGIDLSRQTFVQSFAQSFAIRDRIYILSDNQLISCNRQGSNWQVHFSPKQESKILPEQKAAPNMAMLQGFAGANDHEVILFTITSERNSNPLVRLWKYDLTDNRLSPWIDFAWNGAPRELQQVGSELFGSAPGELGPNIYRRIDVAGEATQNSAAAVKQLQIYRDKYRIEIPDGDLLPAIRDAHLIRGNCKISNGWLTATGWRRDMVKHITGNLPVSQGAATAINLAEYPADSPLKFPAVHDLYPAADGKTLIAVEFNRLTALKRKE